MNMFLLLLGSCFCKTFSLGRFWDS